MRWIPVNPDRFNAESLKGEGWSYAAIALELGLSEKTPRRWADRAAIPKSWERWFRMNLPSVLDEPAVPVPPAQPANDVELLKRLDVAIALATESLDKYLALEKAQSRILQALELAGIQLPRDVAR